MVTTTEPIAVEYGGTRIAAYWDAENEYWVSTSSVQDEAGGGWQQYSIGQLPDCGRDDSPKVLQVCIEWATV